MTKIYKVSRLQISENLQSFNSDKNRFGKNRNTTEQIDFGSLLFQNFPENRIIVKRLQNVKVVKMS